MRNEFVGFDTSGLEEESVSAQEAAPGSCNGKSSTFPGGKSRTPYPPPTPPHPQPLLPHAAKMRGLYSLGGEIVDEGWGEEEFVARRARHVRLTSPLSVAVAKAAVAMPTHTSRSSWA